MYEAILYIAVAYYCVSLLWLPQPDTFSLISSKRNIYHCKIDHGLWGKMSFLVIPKTPKVWKEVEKMGWAPLK